MMRQISLTLAALVSTLWGCASVPIERRPEGSRNVITREQIAAMPQARTAHDILVRVLGRDPSMPLRGGPSSFERPIAPLVVVDGRRLETDALRLVPAVDVEEIRLLTAREGTQLFGTGATHGVIMITTRKG